MGRVRTCIGCRSRAPRAALQRFVVVEGKLVLDARASAPGRGAWVHPDPDCVRTAIERRAFRRALRVADAVEDAARAYADKLSGAPVPDVTAEVDRTMDQS
ncbi:MAG: YlxR family protein [Microbacteriaceae bacterium]|nr:YlxR family protein [Microbacteriaceae bacterium]